MAAASCTILLNGEVIRVFGGNRADVREMTRWYQTIDEQEFRKTFPRFSKKCDSGFNLVVRTRYNKN